jgi:tetratricopeptide (TPR) repeat protein
MVAKLQEQTSGGTNLAAMNRLGVLYAKYGQSDKAEQEFKQILMRKEYLPAILNLGHLYYSRKDWKNALTLYQQAGEASPNDPHTLLALARVNQELQNYADAKNNYERLKAVNPTLASEFAYLEGTNESEARAADVEHQRAAVMWETDQ